MLNKIPELCSLAKEASRHYQENVLLILGKILWLRFYHKKMLDEIRLFGLLDLANGAFRDALIAEGRPCLSWLHRINSPQHSNDVNWKIEFYKTCAKAGIRVPHCYAVGKPTPHIIESLPDSFFSKPVHGAGGFGAAAFTRSGDHFKSWNGEHFNTEQLISYLGEIAGMRALIFQEWFQNHPNLAKISTTALMTIRIATFLDSEKRGEPMVLFAHLRVPAPNSAVDNSGYANKGQAMIELHSVTGAIGQAWSAHPSGFGLIAMDHIREGTIAINDLQIPFWEEVRETAFKLAALFPELPALAWDIGLSSSGPVVIEGNTAWGSPFYPNGLRTVAETMNRA